GPPAGGHGRAHLRARRGQPEPRPRPRRLPLYAGEEHRPDGHPPGRRTRLLAGPHRRRDPFAAIAPISPTHARGSADLPLRPARRMLAAMNERSPTKLGATGPEVFPLGLGCMGMSGVYGATDDAESVATIQAAVDAGVTLIDTGDFYGMGHNELLVGRALAGRRARVLLSVKFGGLRGPDGAFLGFDGRPAAVKNFAAYSLRRLGAE